MFQFPVLHCGCLLSLRFRSLVSLLSQVWSIQHTEGIKLGNIFLGRLRFSYWDVRPLVFDLMHWMTLAVLVRPLLGFLSILSLLLCQKSLKELNLRHQESTHEGSSLGLVNGRFSADSLSVMTGWSLVSRLAVMYSGVKISKRDVSQDEESGDK